MSELTSVVRRGTNGLRSRARIDLAIVTDTDDRKRAADSFRASERNLELIIDAIPALAWSARPDGSAEFLNEHYLEFIGLSADQTVDWNWMSAVHPDDLAGLAATWQRILASGAPGEAEARLRRRDGQYWSVLLQISRMSV